MTIRPRLGALQLISTKPTFNSVITTALAFCTAKLDSRPTVDYFVEDDELRNSRSSCSAFCEHTEDRRDKLEAGSLTELREEICRLNQIYALLTFASSRSETLVSDDCKVQSREAHAWKW